VSQIRVVLADDQGMIRSGLRSLLEAEPDIEVVGEARDGEETVEAVSRLRPDVAIVDIRMPNIDGLTATRRLVTEGTTARILILTTYDLDEYVFEALRAGASGFMLKDAPAEQLTNAIRVVSSGHALLAPAVTRRVVEAFARAAPTHAADKRTLDTLTGRELDVLRLLARGLSNAEIASELFVTPATVKSHVSRLLMKLGLRDRIQAVIHAYETGIVAPESSDR
jgi:DNA-binding NarL/FixJ family response regulator